MSSNNAANSTSGSSLRPRNRRLISGLSDDGNTAEASGLVGRSTPIASPFDSRSASPIPNAHPTRSGSSQQIPRSAPQDRVTAVAGRGEAGKQDPFGALGSLWGSSWSSIQGLASNVLGSEVPSNEQTRRRKPLRSGTPSAVGSKWGVTTAQAQETQIGAGTQEERESKVRAMKRKDLLNANGHIYQDTIGRFKRRNSDERTSSSAPPGEAEDRDALVYVHHVQKQDTLAGLTIRYNCQLATIRKANRMWPNDTAQARKTIVIPVDACGVKGRPCAGPEAEEDDLLIGSENDVKQSDAEVNGWSSNPTGRSRTNTNASNPPASIASTKSDSDPPWIHDSWVVFPGETKPVQIARLSRRTLGFFPPARRKSVSFSAQNTPSTSLDIQRAASGAASPGSYRDDPSVTSSPSASASALSGHTRTRSRKESISQSFILSGPGGVGTFNNNVRKPGPAADGLNKFVKQHLPGISLTPSQEHSSAWMPSVFERSLSLNNSGTATPVAGSSSSTPAIDLNQFGGAIETWMRRTASQVSAAIGEQKGSTRRTAPIPGLGTDIGDLIELQDDAFEIGDDEREQMERGRPSQGLGGTGRPGMPVGMRSREGRASSRKSGKGD